MKHTKQQIDCLKLVERYIVEQDYQKASEELHRGFIWAYSPEGLKYWHSICKVLDK